MSAFAAAFLLPAGGVREALGDLGVERDVAPEDVIHLMYRFGVSYEAILWRLLNLGWISSSQRQTWAKLPPIDLASTLGYDRNWRPGESEPRPDRFKKLALEAWRANRLSRKEAARALLSVAPRSLSKALGAAGRSKSRAPRKLAAEPDWF
jgi:Zn-dependent peptidase ImmA (M78 family)